MPVRAAFRFDSLRSWNGEQSRAFEELSYQLLKDRVPTGTEAIRTGNPDGGVEWYAALPDGTEWGWQAKHVHEIDALLTAMTDSVRRVVKERPNLRKLAFVISRNLSTGTQGGKRKSQRQKYEDKVTTWKTTIPGAEGIEYALVQESDLVAELSKPEHAGRRWFWFDEVVLGSDWLARRYKEQCIAAGEKYRPDLQVDLPIQDDLLALGFDQSMIDQLDRLRRAVLHAISDVSLHPDSADATQVAAYRAVAEAIEKLRTAMLAPAPQPAQATDALAALRSKCRAVHQAIDAADEADRTIIAQRSAYKDKKQPDQEPLTYAYAVRSLRSALSDLQSWLSSSSGRALQNRTYFLTGSAGSGKTHLLLDAVQRALTAGRPAVFLAGARFNSSNLWASITDQLGLPAIGADDILQAMDAAGEAASLPGNRFIVFVDALNETVPADFWLTHLPVLRAAISAYPHVALAVSCRDTYRSVVLEESEATNYVRRTHPGFSDREVEAAQKYFSHYGLAIPRMPLLTPEFSVPLFLKMYSEGLAGPVKQGAAMPTGHQSRVAIFERYVSVKLAAVARRYATNIGSSYELDAVRTKVQQVVDGLLDELSRTGQEAMSVETARRVVASELSVATDSDKLVGLLQDEGILTRELVHLGQGQTGDGVRIVFQAFADFLLLRRRLQRSADPMHDAEIISWLSSSCSFGILEAATILLPEVYDVELPDLLALPPPQSAEELEPTARRQHNRVVQLYGSLVEMLPYRDSEAVSERTVELVNLAMPFISRADFFGTLFLLAPQPDNRLNGDGLHGYLATFRMPRRDTDFGFATYDALDDPFSPAARLARWAAAGPHDGYDPKVIELACVPLCWLLSSPNRPMRDWITKALVQLLRGHLDVMRRLVDRFWVVDDPYVVQRIIVIAYGALLRSNAQDDGAARELAELVRGRVFTRPVRPDELLLDAARGIVRLAADRRLLPTEVLDDARRPYKLTRPGNPPTESRLEEQFGWRHEDEPYEESYASIMMSVLHLGDFGRYVIEPGIGHFSKYRLDQEYPERQRERRLIKSRWRKFEKSLSLEQAENLQKRLAAYTAKIDEAEDVLNGDPPAGLPAVAEDPLDLTSEQNRLLRASSVYPKWVDDSYPVDRARRWIFRRTISLGWTPAAFGDQDRYLGRAQSGREAHKPERWGKKYQWMAYHELLARVADNYHATRRYSDSEPYEGLHQIIADREIDPSLPPVDFRHFYERTGTSAWMPSMEGLPQWPARRLDFRRYQGDVRRLVRDQETEPSVSSCLRLQGSDGSEWIVLHGHYTQVDPLGDKSWRGPQEHLRVETMLARADDMSALLSRLKGGNRRVFDDLVDTHGHVDCCYVGEVGRSGPSCPHRHDGKTGVELGDEEVLLAAAVETYSWEGALYDCSIEDSATAVLPSTFFQKRQDLVMNDHGPAWLDAGGKPLFANLRDERSSAGAFVVRASVLKSLLEREGLSLVVMQWCQRMELTEHPRYRDKHPEVEIFADAWLDAALQLHTTTARRREQDMD